MFLEKFKRTGHPALMRDFTTRMEDFKRDFNEIFSDQPWVESALSPTGYLARTFVPSVDVWETKEGYEIKVEAPGMKPEDIDVILEDNILVLQGEKESERELSDKNMLRKERSYGEFYRAIPLSHSVELDKVQAKMKDGVLKIELEKVASEQENIKKVPILTE